MAMTFEKALRNAMKAYWKGDEFETAESFKDKKYNKKYFDSIKSEYIGGKDKEEKVKGKDKDKY
jgi:hypothetical protein